MEPCFTIDQIILFVLLVFCGHSTADGLSETGSVFVSLISRQCFIIYVTQGNKPAAEYSMLALFVQWFQDITRLCEWSCTPQLAACLSWWLFVFFQLIVPSVHLHNLLTGRLSITEISDQCSLRWISYITEDLKEGRGEDICELSLNNCPEWAKMEDPWPCCF